MDVKWIKIVVDIFDDEKMLLIESLPDADSIIVCWFKLLCLAGKQNNAGVLMLNERIAYTDEMLATVFRRPIQTVRLALETFEQFGMVEIINGAITIPNWGKHQSLDRLEKLREYQRDYHREYRKKQAQIPETCKPESKLYVNAIEEDIEEDKDIDKDKNSFIRVVDAWNSLGLSQVTKIMPGTERANLLNKRIKDYGVDKVLEAIENVRKSTFLTGGGNNGWTATFDWFIKPNNFPKVLDGNYSDNQKPAKKYTTNADYKPPKPTNMGDLRKLVDMI